MILASFVNIEFLLAVALYGLISKLYSHPAIRLKRYPVTSFLVVFFFQGCFIYITSYAAIMGQSLSNVFYIAGYAESMSVILAGMICSCLIGANYPLTQVYQHEEDTKRGDITLSIKLGIRGSFIFSALLFSVAVLLSFFYWHNMSELNKFWLFLLFCLPVFITFMRWFQKVWLNPGEANYKNMSQMTWIGGVMMLLYFGGLILR
jgi:1,4-dihydroxy-2-naphthoate octaprenyltransferase